MILRGRKIIVLSSEVPTDPELSGTRVAGHGDSITEGANASSQSLAYPAIYQGATGLFFRTMSKYSKTVQENVQSWNATNSLENTIFSPTPEQAQYNPVFSYDPDYKYIMFRLGINDCLQKPGSATSAATFKNKYLACLNRFFDLNWPANRLKLINIGTYHGPNGEVAQAVIDYNAAIAQIGAEKNIQVVDLYSFDLANGGAALYDVDGVHPNNNGHSKHGLYIASQLP